MFLGNHLLKHNFKCSSGCFLLSCKDDIFMICIFTSANMQLYDLLLFLQGCGFVLCLQTAPQCSYNILPPSHGFTNQGIKIQTLNRKCPFLNRPLGCSHKRPSNPPTSGQMRVVHWMEKRVPNRSNTSKEYKTSKYISSMEHVFVL